MLVALLSSSLKMRFNTFGNRIHGVVALARVHVCNSLTLASKKLKVYNAISAEVISCV